jgi:predicted transcriptional regulator
VIGRRIEGIEGVVDNFRFEVSTAFAGFVRTHRLAGKTYREIAESEGVHPSTIRKYIKWLEGLESRPGYASEQDLPPRCNALLLACAVCGETFTSARADRRFCTSACRQDAYRKRKQGAAV